MERKLSQKAVKLCRRFTFTRPTQSRNKASLRSQASNSSNSRPRATSPVSASTSDTTYNDTRRCYDFTDEPGYFRPASPLIHRQEIEEDLEADMKYACMLLSHSIERGGPQTDPFSKSEEERLDQECLSPEKPGVEAETVSHKGKHDSGVGLSVNFQSSGKAYRNNLSVTTSMSNSTRFYSQRQSSSSSQPQQRESIMDRGRSREQSHDFDLSSRRSRSSSPMLFPYSSPQLHFQWQPRQTFLGRLESAKDVECPKEESDLPVEDMVDAVLGAEGLTWLRASQEDENSDTNTPDTPESQSSQTSEDRLEMIRGPPPTRFYSVRRHSPATALGRCHSIMDDNRYEPSRNLSTEAEERTVNTNIPVHLWGKPSSFQTDVLKHHETIDPVIILDPVIIPHTTTQPRHRRRRAEELLKKLTGLGRRKSDPVEQGRCISRAVEVVA